MNIFDIKYWEGNFFDLWTIPHFLTGSILGIIIVLLDISFFAGFLTTLFIASLWEVFEILGNFNEVWTNRLTDIMIALVGYSFFFYIAKFFDTNSKGIMILLITTVTIYILFSIFGWVAYKHYSV